MELASQVSTVAGLPLQIAPAVGPIAKFFLKFHPPTQVKRWSERANQIMAVVSQCDEQVPDYVMEYFIGVCEGYVVARNDYLKSVKGGSLSHWTGEGRDKCNAVIEKARLTVNNGEQVSNQAYVAGKRCARDHRYVPRNSDGKCPICFPPSLSYSSTRRRRLPESYYTDDWFKMIGALSSTNREAAQPEELNLSSATEARSASAPTQSTVDITDSNQIATTSRTVESLSSGSVPYSPPSYTRHTRPSSGPSAVQSDCPSYLSSESEGLRNEEIRALYNLCVDPHREAPAASEEVSGWEAEAQARDEASYHDKKSH